MTADRILRAIDATLTATEAPMTTPDTAAAPYDAGDAAPRRHIALTPPTADEQNRALTAELNRHHTALRNLEVERDDLRIQLANVTANGDHLRERLTDARRHINGLEADLRTARRDNRELTAERDRARAELAPALELLAVLDDAHERIDRARANYATRPRQDAAEPPHSLAGGREAHHEPAEAHRGAGRGDDDELAPWIRRAIGDPGSIAGYRRGPHWPEGHEGWAEQTESVTAWATRAVLRVLAVDGRPRCERCDQTIGVNDLYDPPLPGVGLWEHRGDCPVDPDARDATLAQIARDAAQSGADVAAGRVSDHLGDSVPVHAQEPPAAADLLRMAAAGRREYAKGIPEKAGPLELQAHTLEFAARIVEGDLDPLYDWLPSWQWTGEMNARLHPEREG